MRLLPKFFRSFICELLVLFISAFVYALAFPSFLDVNGWGFLAFFAWIPVFWVIDRARWEAVWF